MQSLRINKELKKLKQTPIDGVTIDPQNEDNTIWHITLEGPSGTAYEGGKFVISADFTDNYPFKPP